MNKKTGNQDCRLVFVCLFLVLVTLLPYWQVKNFEFVNYDDDKYVTVNRHVTGGLTIENIKWAFQSTYAGNWHPLTWLSLMTDAELFGLNARFFHITNLFLHIFNTLLLLLILYRITGALWKSAVVAALFALHPLHVESVAWVTERKDVLSIFFMLLALWAYVKYVHQRDYKRYGLVLLCFALGLMSKQMVVTFPFVLLLLDYWPLRRFSFHNGKEHTAGTIHDGLSAGRVAAGLVYEKIPLLILAGLSVFSTIIAHHEEIIVMRQIPMQLRIENALVSYCTYIEKMFWPESLAVLYPHPAYISAWHVSAATIFLLIISSLAFYTIKRNPYIFVGWFWYLGTLVPVIGLVQVGVQSMADRYTYLPLIGLFIIVVWAVDTFTERLPYKKIIPALSLLVVSILVPLSFSQVKYWKNSFELFNHTLAVTEKNYTMHCNMGVLLAGQGKIKEAEFHYTEALKITPDDVDTNMNYANLLSRQGKLEEAVVRYNVAIKGKPDFAEAYNNLGITYIQLGNRQKAIEQFRQAVKHNPDYQDAQNNLRIAQTQQDRLKEPASATKTAKIGNIDTFQGRMQAGTALIKSGDLDGAIKHFREALKLEPENMNAHVSMGMALAYKQDYEQAISHFRRAITINPSIPEIYNSLAVALTYTGKTDEAMMQLKKALEINPRFAKAHNSLGVMLAQSGNIDEGIAHLREAINIDPDYIGAKKNLDLVLRMKGNK
jgi:protein O-mannosyl-transferase